MTTVADRVLVARVLALDARGTVGAAIAIRGDRVMRVGTEADVLALRGPDTRVHELRGATIIPGFNDTHAHMDAEGLKTLRPSLAGCRSVADVLARIAALAASTPRGEWILTMPVGEPPFYFGGPAALAERRMPARHELDAAAPDHPVCILPPSGYWSGPPCHTAMNSAALALCGVDRARPARAPGVDVLRDERGEPTGVVVDHNFPAVARLDVTAGVPGFTAADRLEAIRRAQRLYHAVGTTSIFEGHGCAPDVIAAYRALRERGELTMRTGLVVSPVWDTRAEAERGMRDALAYARGLGLGDDLLRVTGVHVAHGGDGAIAELARRDPGNLGWSNHVLQANGAAEFEALAMLAARHDVRLFTLVVDRLAEMLPVLERVDRRHGLRGRRWVIEHMSTAALDDLRRLPALGVGVTLIPEYHLWKFGARYLDLDAPAADLTVPARQLHDLGVPVAAGTDNSPYDPLGVVRALATRVERTTGRVIGPNGRIDVELALRLMTVAGAWLTGEERVKGPLSPGCYADLAVLGRDPLATPPDELEGIDRVATMVGGRWVHGALD